MPSRAAGRLASLRAELLVMRKRPVLWTLLLAVPVNMLIEGYLTDYVAYRTAGTGGPGSYSYSAALMLPGVLPGQYLTAALSGFGTYSGLYGPAALFLLGAMVAGTDWGRGTIRTALLQGPGRLATRVSQDLAVLLAAAASVIVTFVLAAAVTTGMAAALAGQAPPLESQFPVPAHVAMAVTGALLRLYELLPDASINTVVNLYNPNTVDMAGSVQPPSGVELAPALAFGTLSLYVLVFLAIPALITMRRNVS